MTLKNNMVLAMSAGLLLSALSSCIQVKYQDEGDSGLMPNEAEMSLDLQLDNTWATDHIPEDYKVLMSRKVNTMHYMWDVDKEGNFGNDEAKKVILNGEYYAMAFNQETSVYEYAGVADFAEDESVSMKSLYAVIPQMTEEELAAIPDNKILEYNAYAPFIRSADIPLLLGINQNAQILHAQENVVKFPLQNLTIELTFFIDVISGEGVEIDDISASLSGVCDRVQLMSGLVSKSDTYRVLVDVTKMMSIGDKDIYEGVTNVLGIFPSESQSKITGPGVLHLTIKASIDKGGEKIQKVFNAGINLRSFLVEENLMEETEDKSGYRITKNESVINIPTVLRVNANQIQSEGGEGSPVWVDSDITLDVEL